jgi:hypothetical protein
LRPAELKKGGHSAALLLALALSAAVVLLLAGPASAEVPWGAGCAPTAEGEKRTAASCGALLVDGEAIPPPGAPAAVKRVIRAANEIRHRPYVWGGGHRSWFSRGYDCSGAVSYALHGAGLLGVTMVSGQLADWGEKGAGRWITVYANRVHVFMVVAGLRFDTRGDPLGTSGPRWHRSRADSTKFTPRHPAAL